jgi:hypothetical protein
MEDNASVLRIHFLPPGVGDIHASTWSQVLQGSHHKVHVIPHFTHIPYGVPHAHRCHSCLSHSATEVATLLVCNISHYASIFRFMMFMFNSYEPDIYVNPLTYFENCGMSVSHII